MYNITDVYIYRVGIVLGSYLIHCHNVFGVGLRRAPCGGVVSRLRLEVVSLKPRRSPLNP